MHVFADIITIGDELLIGQVVDTNSAFIGSELTRIGVTVRRIISLPDKAPDISESLAQSIRNADVIIITGGLGPTSDDITKDTLVDFFGGRLILHEPSLKNIERLFPARGIELTERNRKQAEIPNVCTPLINRNGTAPGMLFRKEGKLIFSLPGVPFEMKTLLLEEVFPVIEQNFTLPTILYKTVLTTGLSESSAADRIKDWEENLPSEFGLAYLPSPGVLRLRLSIYGDDVKKMNERLIIKVNQLAGILGKEHVFGFDDATLQLIIGERLKEVKMTLSLAESCTGGFIAHLITSVPGASAYFLGSAIVYSNESKTELLGISKKDMLIEGTVSRIVVEKMAEGAKKLFNTDFSIATSGIAGPDGGTGSKPVGTIWIAVASPENVISFKYVFGENRERNIIRAAVTALNLLRISIDKFIKK